MIPGFFLSLIAVVVVSLMTNKPGKAVREEFNEMEEIMSN